MPLVLLDKMKIISTNNNGPHHLRTMASASKDATPDGNIASKGAFLINVGSCIKKIKLQSANSLTFVYHIIVKK